MNLNPNDLSRLSNIFKNLGNKTDEIHSNWKRSTNSDILIVDGTNTFIRCWSANPSMDENGNHTGGVVGFLKSVGYAIKTLAPTRCVIIFDGIGGSFKRRKIYPEYKEKRKGRIRLNRAYEEMSDVTTEEESCSKQYLRLIHYLQALPVNILSIDHVEADDVIAYLATEYFKDSRKKYIMSSDKDFLQLASESIAIWSPTKKRIYGVPEVLSEYNIHPNNFVLFRTMDGDDSDNVNGIEGAGPKTVVKHFPFLNEEKIHTIDEVVSIADGLKNKYKVCERIVEGKGILERNYALFQLKETALTTVAQLHCNECLETAKIPRLDRGVFIRLVREDMIDSNLPNHTMWLNEVFGSMDSVVRSE
jgi:5'-3' exonuclease